MIIGICGKSASGKSTLAKKIMEKSNLKSIHVEIDKIGHKVLLLPTVKERLINTFGNSIIVDNNVDRKRLGKIVFNSKEEMDKLTDITWEAMQIELNKILDENKSNLVILDWLLLPKTEFFNKCDIRVLLDIPYEIRKQRAMERDGISEEAFDLREKATYEYDKNTFDYVLEEYDDEVIERIVKSL